MHDVQTRQGPVMAVLEGELRSGRWGMTVQERGVRMAGGKKPAGREERALFDVKRHG